MRLIVSPFQTSFLDASHLYGSSVDEAQELRLHKNGQLKHFGETQRRELLPPSEKKTPGCASKGKACFLSGSTWTNLLPTNAAFHTLWMRQHNAGKICIFLPNFLVARELQQRNKYWDDERLYQGEDSRPTIKIFLESRRIIIAQIQHITYSEFLPILLGQQQLAKQGLKLRTRSFDSGYDMVSFLQC